MYEEYFKQLNAVEAVLKELNSVGSGSKLLKDNTQKMKGIKKIRIAAWLTWFGSKGG